MCEYYSPHRPVEVITTDFDDGFITNFRLTSVPYKISDLQNETAFLIACAK
jgi:hypothetical protein